MKRQPLTDNAEKVIKLFHQGFSNAQIAEIMGVNKPAVHRFAIKHGLTDKPLYTATFGPQKNLVQKRVIRSTVRTCDKPPVPAPKKYQKAADELRDYRTIVFNASVYTGRREDAAYWYVNERRVHQSELLEMAQETSRKAAQ